MDATTLFQRLEAQYALPKGTLDAFWAYESNRGKNTFNPLTRAAGHFQFIPKTADAMGLSDPYDLAASAQAAAKYASTNAKRLRDAGLSVTPQSLYILHQQGTAGGLELLKNPDAPAVEVLSKFYRSPDVASSAVSSNGGQTSMTAGQFASTLATRFSKKAGIPVDIQSPVSPAKSSIPSRRNMLYADAPSPGFMSRTSPEENEDLLRNLSDVIAKLSPSRRTPSAAKPLSSSQPQSSGQRSFLDGVLSLPSLSLPRLSLPEL